MDVIRVEGIDARRLPHGVDEMSLVVQGVVYHAHLGLMVVHDGRRRRLGRRVVLVVRHG